MMYQYAVVHVSQRERERGCEREGGGGGIGPLTEQEKHAEREEESFLFSHLPVWLYTLCRASKPDRNKLHRLEMKANEHPIKSESTPGGVHVFGIGLRKKKRSKSDFLHKYS